MRRAGYLRKWVVLGTAIGVIAGLGAVAFYLALVTAGHLLLGLIGGYEVPRPLGEGGAHGSGHFSRPWAVPLVVGLGGLLSGALVYVLAPEAEGHGTDAAINAVHQNPRMIRARAVLVKLVASAITIGSGGSGGREGPTAQISAGFGSLLARTLNLSPEDGRIAVSVGIGSGIGAIFGAPLGGAVLAADIVYRDDFEEQALIPGLISAVIAYTVFGFTIGWTPLFGYALPGYEFHEPVQLLWFALIGLAAAGTGLVYSGTFYRVVSLTKRTRISSLFTPAIGGVLVGLLALAIPQVLGTGYGWVQASLDRDGLMSIPLWIVLLLPFAKVLATSLSIGTGGSGGIFGPGMIIGGFTGAAVWRLLEGFGPGVPHSPAAFVIVGMMACFGAIARAPLAMMLMVAEMTGSLTILPPAMVAVGLAYLIVRSRGDTIYRSQLRNREEAHSARLRLGLPLLRRVPVTSAMAPPRLVLRQSDSPAHARAALAEAEVPGAPVLDQESRFVGVVHAPDLRHADSDTIGHLVDSTAGTVPENATLDDALDAIPTGGRWITVLDDGRHVLGTVAYSDIVRGYRRAIRSDARRMSHVSAHSSVVELRVGPDSPLGGRPLKESALPHGAVVVSVQHGDALHFGIGTQPLHPGDVVTVLSRPGVDAQLRRLLDAEQPATPADGTTTVE
ncbi:MAG TPA: chloride channel protein [Segeticoccus sp.]|uniref:chloride channel protein n=1 Tax=Segeticoccus sp. TaxID=2706531 RepID=UPI002D7EDC93|nr:chloride channel protein [Segeticoccus sp.]HET8601926.1 chloride channel protein [Segeticoccus sp.]